MLVQRTNLNRSGHRNILCLTVLLLCELFQRRKLEFGQDYEFDHQQLSAEQLQQYEEEALPLNWQTAALFLAVLACLLFFILAACILVHHTRQWRRMERRLDQGEWPIQEEMCGRELCGGVV